MAALLGVCGPSTGSRPTPPGGLGIGGYNRLTRCRRPEVSFMYDSFKTFSLFVCLYYMSQTDRQTDKATHWKSAIFDTDDNWSKLDTLPAFIKTVHRQKEICPTTQKPHFQVHVICHQQVRLTKMCSWIKATKWLPVIGKEHIENSIKYTSKTDTAVEGTHTVTQGEKYYQTHELLLEIARHYVRPDFNQPYFDEADKWETLTRRMISFNPKWANKLCNPALKKAWDWWGTRFIDHVERYSDETCGAYIIEGPASEEDHPVPEECLIE